MSAPKVTVIITAYNRAELLRRAINSVLAQSFRDYEVIIVDDSSLDDTPQVIASLCDPRIRAFRHEVNRGQSAAINTGLAEARGKYFTNLDDDDEWPKDRLELLSAVLDSAPANVGVVYGWQDFVNDLTGEFTASPRRRTDVGDEFFRRAMELDLIGHPVFMARTSVAREVGAYDDDLVNPNDWDLLLRIIQKYDMAVCPHPVVIRHVEHGFSRVTDGNPKSNRGKAEWMRKHEERFASYFASHPRSRARVRRHRALYEMELGETKAAVALMGTAFMADPADTVRAVLRHTRFGAAKFIRSVTR